MKLLILFSILALSLAEEAPEVHESVMETDYHNKIGIPRAAEIKAAEEATDFSGSRIVGGSPAWLGQFPFLGGLVISLTNGWTSVCGSSLLSNNHAVTAAHCWFDRSNQARQFTVVLGSVALFSGGVRINTNSVITHPQYNVWTLVNDVAVIRLNTWVNFNNNIQPIALAAGTNQFIGSWATAAGFGAQRDGAGIGNNQQKHYVSLQVVDNQVCRNVYGAAGVIASTLCTSGAGGRSTCGGDSGGPLEVYVGNVRTLIGITSFGHVAGCQLGHPAGFARVTSFNNWIRQNMF